MIKKLLLFALLTIVFHHWTYAQTEEELEATRTEKQQQIKELQGQINTLKGEVAKINDQLLEFPRWETGAFGVLGVNFKGFNNWLARDKPNVVSNSISISANGFANLFTEKSFWRNSGNINLGWIKFDDRDNPDDNPELESAADVINLSSHYGYKFSEKLAISTLGEYRSTIINNFNDPGYLDLGIGMTWTPINNLVVVANPLNYNIVFTQEGDSFDSSLGAKIVADYTQEVTSGVKWRSNLSLFLSYKELSELSNWTWVNGLGFTAWKGIGVGLELGLRSNKQEFLAFNNKVVDNPDSGLDQLDDNPLQTYWIIGLSYNF